MNRSSSLKIREPQILHKGGRSRKSVDSSTINLDLRGLDNITPIVTKPLYTESKKICPTASQILGTLHREEPFEIDKNWIREDFGAEYNKDKRDWYFKTYSKKETGDFRTEFYNYMIENEINLYFFDWFKIYSQEHNLEYPFNNKEIYPLEKVN